MYVLAYPSSLSFSFYYLIEGDMVIGLFYFCNRQSFNYVPMYYFFLEYKCRINHYLIISIKTLKGFNSLFWKCRIHVYSCSTLFRMNLSKLWYYCRPPISELIDVFVASCPVAQFPWRWSKVCVVNILVLVSMMDGCRHIGRENLIDFPFLFPLDSKDTAGNQNDSIWANIGVSLSRFAIIMPFELCSQIFGWMPFTQLMPSFCCLPL